MRELFTEIWSTVRRNKLRTALTGFAVAWGIFMLIFLLGAGNGLINAVESNSGRYLDNSMMVYGGYTSKAYKGLKEGRSVELNTRDLEMTQEQYPDVVDQTGALISHSGAQITYGENYVSSSLTGVHPVIGAIHKREILYGRFINDIDNEQNRKVLVIGESQAKELMGYRDISTLVGKYVKVDNFAFLVAGIYKSDESRTTTQVYCPFTTINMMYQYGDKVGDLAFTFHGLETVKANEEFEKNYKAAVNANHQAAPDDDEAVWINNRFRQNLQMNQGMGIIRTALWIIGIFTLLSGIVGVSNIMLITVKERTREFGIRKAIGASPWNILKLIIVESVIITTFFGYVGMVLGVAANEYMDATIGHMSVNSGLFEAKMFDNPTVGLDVCIEATIVMILAGTFAGFIPARKAAHIRPIEALRAE